MRKFSLSIVILIFFQLGLVLSSQAQHDFNSSSKSAAKWLSDYDLSSILNEIYEQNPQSQDELPILSTDTQNFVNIDYMGEHYQFEPEDIKPDFTNNPYDAYESSSGWGNSSGGDGVACFETATDRQSALQSIKEQGYLSHADKLRIKSLQLYEIWELQNPWHEFQDLDHFSWILASYGNGIISVNDALATLYYGITHTEDRSQLDKNLEKFADLRVPKDTIVGLLTNALQPPGNLRASVAELIKDIAPNVKDAQTVTEIISFYQSSVRKNIQRYQSQNPYQLSSGSSQKDARKAFLDSFETQAPSLALIFKFLDSTNSVESKWRPAVLKDVNDSCNMSYYKDAGALASAKALQCKYHNKLLNEHPTCMKVQLAHRVSYSQGSEYMPTTVVHYDRWLYENKLSPVDQKMLQFHEYFYVLASEISHKNSDDVRKIIRIQAHPLFRDLLTRDGSPRLRQKLSALLYNWALGDYPLLGDKSISNYSTVRDLNDSLSVRLYLASTKAFRKMQHSNKLCETMPSADIRAQASKYNITSIGHGFCEYYFHEISDKKGFFTQEEAFFYVAFFLHGRFDDQMNTEALMSFDLENPYTLSPELINGVARTCRAVLNGSLLNSHTAQARAEVLSQAQKFCENFQ